MGEPENGQGRPEAVQLSQDTGESGGSASAGALEDPEQSWAPSLLETSKNSQVGATSPFALSPVPQESTGYLKSIC